MAVACLVLLSALPASGGNISLSGLIHTYDGSQKSAIVTTDPPELAYTITYAGSPAAPANAGSYEVVATLVDEPVSATATLVIQKASQLISFPSLSNKTYGDPPFALNAFANPSGLPVNFASSNPAVATVSGNLVTIVGAGTTTITASQPGNSNYNPAPGVNRNLTVVGLPQNITFDGLPTGKKYGDGPFTVSATVDTGLPITFRSSDPTVATVSGNLVTIVGAGQCGILAFHPGNSVYAYSAVAQPLIIAPAEELPMPPPALLQLYDGSPKGIDPVALPTGAATQIRYRPAHQTEPAPVAQVAFQNGPDTLNLGYQSFALEANRYWGLGKCVRLAGTARKLHSCDVTLVTWARYDDPAAPGYSYLDWAGQNPSLVVPPAPGVSIPGNSGGWYHPITLSFYDYDGNTQTWIFLTRKTVLAFIPWRPLRLADGNPFPHNGYAFRVSFDFPDGVILPDDVWVAVSFNTNNQGEAPIGAPGPYDALNISNPGAMVAGTDLLSTYKLLYKQWTWRSDSASVPVGPMLRLRTIPTHATLSPPVDAGNYEVKTVITGKGLGGEATTELTIGYDFAGWKTREISLGRLPAGQSGDTEDPDKDGFTNLQEYAFNLNPGTPDRLAGHPPVFSFLPPHLGLTYRRNLQAVDLTYSIEGNPDLANPSTWNPIPPLLETPISDDGTTRVIRAAVPKPTHADSYFLRLKVSRNPQP